MKRLVFLGECMVEMAPDGDKFSKSYAGDAFNMAWYSRQLCPAEWSVDFVSAVGDDSDSRQMLRFMAAAGVGVDHVQRLPQSGVGLYMISLQDGERSFSYWRDASAARRMADDSAALEAAVQGADVLCLSGISIAILGDSGRANLAEVLKAAAAKGAKIVFDPNIRPRLWDNKEQMLSAISTFAALSDTVLASYDDEAEHFGDASPEHTLQRYLGLGCTEVVVKNGAAPILAYHKGEREEVTPKIVSKVVDSTAAGDSFNGAFLVRQAEGRTMQQSVQAGSALAAVVIQRRGALAVIDSADLD